MGTIDISVSHDNYVVITQFRDIEFLPANTATECSN